MTPRVCVGCGGESCDPDVIVECSCCRETYCPLCSAAHHPDPMWSDADLNRDH